MSDERPVTAEVSRANQQPEEGDRGASSGVSPDTVVGGIVDVGNVVTDSDIRDTGRADGLPPIPETPTPVIVTAAYRFPSPPTMILALSPPEVIQEPVIEK